MADYNQERTELHKHLWAVANDLRGSIDGWDFKAYVLGTLFYCYLSEDITKYINKVQEDFGFEGFDYTRLDDDATESAVAQVVAEKGYFIYPSQLFCNVCKKIKRDRNFESNLNEELSRIFRSIEASAMGTASEDNVKGMFSDYVVDNMKLGASVVARNRLIAKVLLRVEEMTSSYHFDHLNNDIFGDTYEYLMQMYASGAGKSGGEFFTPQEVSELLVRLCVSQTPNIKKVYDPACGSGSLLLKFARYLGENRNELHYFGQEINPTTYNLCRSNMFLHEINYDHFHIGLGNTLMNPMWKDAGPYDAIVSNPPYSIQWEGKENPLLINDERFAPAGVLAPTSKADLAFVMHMLSYLDEAGTAAIVEFPGVLYRGGAEQKIREYLVENNYVDAVIQLPANLFFGVSIATCIIVLKKNKKVNDVLFINASEMYEKVGSKNRMRKSDQDKIIKIYQDRMEEDYVSCCVPNKMILINDCNLSVSGYVEEEDKREYIDIKAVNAEIEQLEDVVYELQEKVNAIVTELGEEEL